MRYTDSQGLPWPATRREMANAPLASELLARKVDTKLGALNAAWQAEMVGESTILTLATNITGIPNNADWTVFMDTVQQDRPVGSSLSSQSIAARTPGWYHCYAYIHATPETTTSGGSRRWLHVDIQGSPDPFQSSVVTERYSDENYQVTGGVGLGVEFVTFLRPSYSITAYLYHTNATSLRVDAGLSQFSFTKICGEV